MKTKSICINNNANVKGKIGKQISCKHTALHKGVNSILRAVVNFQFRRNNKNGCLKALKTNKVFCFKFWAKGESCIIMELDKEKKINIALLI